MHVYANESEFDAADLNMAADGKVAIYLLPETTIRLVRKLSIFIRLLLTMPWWRLTPLLHLKSTSRLYAMMRTRQFLENGHVYDLYHGHFAHAGDELGCLKQAGIISGPVVVSLHGYDVNRTPDAGGAEYHHLFEHCERYLVTTRFMAGQAKKLGCDTDKITILPTGIHSQKFQPRRVRTAADSAIELLTVARLVSQKGLDYGLRAVARLLGEGCRVHYRIIGEGPLLNDLMALATELEIADSVTFDGAQPHASVVQALQTADVFLFPTIRSEEGDEEAQGIVLLEAQASGVPVVATDCGGVPEVVRTDASAILVTERDVSALSEAVKTVVSGNRWQEMSESGPPFIRENFDIHRQMEKMIDLYGQLVSNKVSP